MSPNPPAEPAAGTTAEVVRSGPELERAEQPVRRIQSGSLLSGRDEVLIQHRGIDYRLRQTAQGKLILTK